MGMYDQYCTVCGCLFDARDGYSSTGEYYLGVRGRDCCSKECARAAYLARHSATEQASAALLEKGAKDVG